MFRDIIYDVKAKRFTINQIIMDHDTSGANITCTSFSEVHTTYCGNHTVNAFHSDLTKLKSVKCKAIYCRICSVQGVYSHIPFSVNCLFSMDSPQWIQFWLSLPGG